MKTVLCMLLAAALLSLTAGAEAQTLTKIRFVTDWKAQAEHGGFYEALAEGYYARA